MSDATKWTDAHVEALRESVKGWTPWLGGPDRATAVFQAVFKAGTAGIDNDLFHGKSKQAKFIRNIFNFAVGEDLPGAREDRIKLLAKAPFSPGPQLIEVTDWRANEAARHAYAVQQAAEREAAAIQRGKEQEVDPEFIARRAAVQAKYALRGCLEAALARMDECTSKLSVRAALARKEPLVWIPNSKPINAGVIRPGHRAGVVRVGTVLYEVPLARQIKVVPLPWFVSLVRPYQDVWTDNMREAAALLEQT